MKTPGFRCDLCKNPCDIDSLFGLDIRPPTCLSLDNHDRTFAITNELAAECSVHICTECAEVIQQGMDDYNASTDAEGPSEA